MRTGDTPATTRELLKALMEERELSKRSLAVLLAGENGPKAEGWRRDVGRYLEKSNPTERKAVVMESKLGLPHGYFPRHRMTRSTAPAGDKVSEAQDETLTTLVATVERMQEALDSLEERVSELERPPVRKGGGSAGEGRPK